jgi:hypothetical protein
MYIKLRLECVYNDECVDVNDPLEDVYMLVDLLYNLARYDYIDGNVQNSMGTEHV